MTNTGTRLLAVLLVSLAAVVGQSEAAVLYSNFGPGMTFDTNPFHGWTINGFLGPDTGQQAISNQFTPDETAFFTSAQVALTSFGGPGDVTVYLQEDANGRPGAIIDQINVTGLTSTPTIFTATSVQHPRLQAGTPYWLTVVAGGSGVIAGWNWNSIGDVSNGSNFATTQNGSPSGPWGLNGPGPTRSVFQINGVEFLVGIDILPGHINPRERGKIPVAILGSSDFDVTVVNPGTVRFGPTGTEAAPVRFVFTDVNGDGFTDLLLFFEAQSTGIACGDMSATLTGLTDQGHSFQGTDTFETVGCEAPIHHGARSHP